MKYKFPENWKIDLDTYSSLAERLTITPEELRKLEKSIPKQYRSISIYKKYKWRDLCVPSDDLKNIQRLILDNLLVFDFPKYVQGGVRGGSIVKNAKMHRNKKWVARLDIKDFFPSVHFSNITQIFNDLGCSKEVAQTLAHYTSFDYQLPQGAPTSPALSNLILFNLDLRIAKLCQTKQITYSRYFDDITISSQHPLESVCRKVLKIAHQTGFKIHTTGKKKYAIQPSSENQVVTGLIVNGEKIKADPDFLLQLEGELENLGTRYVNVLNPQKTIDRIRGMIAFLKSVEPSRAMRLESKFQQINLRRFGLSENN